MIKSVLKSFYIIIILFIVREKYEVMKCRKKSIGILLITIKAIFKDLKSSV